jgi:hypothetical protein
LWQFFYADVPGSQSCADHCAHAIYFDLCCVFSSRIFLVREICWQFESD